MATTVHAVAPSVDIGGTTFDARSNQNVVEVIVDTDLTAATTCTVTILDRAGEVLNGLDYRAELTVSAASIGDDKAAKVFSGEVYSMEFESDERGTYSRVTAFDTSYRLKQHRVTKAYKNAKDSDIAGEIASEVGLKRGTIDSTAVLHEHIGQINETHWDFLRMRAAANDFEVYVADGALNFRKPAPASEAPTPGGHSASDPLQLTMGRNLTHLRTRVTAAQQVEEVEVRGWDPKTKKELVGTAPATTTATALSATPAELAKKVKSKSLIASRAGFATQAECDALAKGVAERVGSTFAYAEGTAHGDARLVAGAAVSIGAAGPFDGKYLLTRARHIFRAGDYHVKFTVSGSHDRSQFGMNNNATDASWGGTYPAVVTGIQDPQTEGRVTLKFPWLDKDYESGWARTMQIGAGGEEGIQWSPEVNDEVLVAFVNGDPRLPTVLGGLYNGKDKVPFPNAVSKQGEVEIRGMKSRKGNQLAFHDKAGEERIEIITASGSCTIVLNDKDKGIVIETDADISVNAKKNVKIEAAAEVNVKSTGNLKIDAGANAELSAKANFKISAGAMVEIKGALVKLN